MAKSAKTKTPNSKPSQSHSGTEQVDEFIATTVHLLKDVMQSTREIILSADKQITEHIKWNAPSFCTNGDDRITFNLYKAEYLLLVFHRGAKVKDSKGKETLINDTT